MSKTRFSDGFTEGSKPGLRQVSARSKAGSQTGSLARVPSGGYDIMTLSIPRYLGVVLLDFPSNKLENVLMISPRGRLGCYGLHPLRPFV